jgi:hypothetical protein
MIFQPSPFHGKGCCYSHPGVAQTAHPTRYGRDVKDTRRKTNFDFTPQNCHPIKMTFVRVVIFVTQYYD